MPILSTLLLILAFVSHLALPSSILFAAVAPSDQATLQLDDYHIGANDVIEISVYGEEDLSLELQVTASGYVSYPLLGRIKVLGVSVVALEDYIREALARDYIRNPQVRVFVKEFSNIFVMGQVEEPGRYPFAGGMTVLQATSPISCRLQSLNSARPRPLARFVQLLPRPAKLCTCENAA